jgi:nucleotide-binding universal stress UspA family protein
MYARILVPVDGSDASARGLDEAIDLARHLQARMQLVHIVEPYVMVTPETMPITVQQIAEIRRSAGIKLLQESESKARNAGVEVEVELIESPGGSAGEHIVNKAKEMDANLIVCGTHGRRGMRRMLMGSDAEYVVRRSAIPVLLVRNKQAAASETAEAA